MALTGLVDARPQRQESIWPSGQASERSCREEDAERRKFVQEEFICTECGYE